MIWWPFVESLLKEAKRDERSKISARLATEVMECELSEDNSEFMQGHLHGVKRAIYLIRSLVEKEQH